MSQKRSPKIVCIGLDSMDSGLLVEWAKKGILPNIARLFEKSAWGGVSCPPGVTTGAVWTSFNTGLWPGHHGQYAGATYFDPNSYDDSIFYNDSTVKWQPFWEKFGNMGRRSVVFDAPYLYNVEVQNSIIMADWGTHDRAPDAVFRTHPEELARDIEKRFGLDDKVGRCDINRPHSDDEFVAFVDNLVDRVQRKTAISHYLLDQMETTEWDLFYVTFGEPHCVGHQCWHIHDQTHDKYDAILAERTGDPVLRVYSQIDSSIGELVSRIGDDATTLIYTDAGMEAQYTGSHFMDDILLRIEHHRNRTLRVAMRKGLQEGLRPVWRMMPQRIRQELMPARRIGKRYFVDRQHRRFFEIRNTNQAAGIRLNLSGRERNGVIERGKEYNDICNEIIEDLATFKNQETDEQLFTGFVKTSETYEGEFVDLLPDIQAIWNRSAPIRRVSSPKFGILENKAIYERTGDHISMGMFLAFGPGIEPRALNRIVSPTDFAPTFASLLGLSEAFDFDGEIIRELMGN